MKALIAGKRDDLILLLGAGMMQKSQGLAGGLLGGDGWEDGDRRKSPRWEGDALREQKET